MLPDKMAISHSSHLFVPVTFVFCLLLPLIHASDSYDYIGSRQFEKNPVVSEHRNTHNPIQRLPNYNWKPLDKYYGPRKELTKKNLEFTKPEDLEQRMADSWIKKMQEISRQEREKWAAYRRNVKLTLDNVEETTKAGKLRNDESIPIPMFPKSEQYYEKINERSKLPLKLFEGRESLEASVELDPTFKLLERHPSMDQNSDVKDDSSWSKQSAETHVDEAPTKELKNNEWNTNMKNLSKEFLRKAIHRRHKDYEISYTKEDPAFKRNAATDYEKSKFEKDRPSLIINLHPEESISQQFKNSHVLDTHTNFIKSSENDNDLNHINDSKKSLVKKYLRQFNFSRDNKKESSNNKGDEEKTANLLKQKSKKNGNVNLHSGESISQQSKTSYVPENPTNKSLKKFSETSENLNHTTDFKLPSQNDKEINEDSEKGNEMIIAKSLTWKIKKKKDDAGGKDMAQKRNHEKSFHSDRWGTIISSSPTEFLKDMSRRLKHRKDTEQLEKDENRDHSFSRWGMSVALPPKEFFEDISMHRGHDRFTTKTRSRPNEVKGSSNDQFIKVVGICKRLWFNN